jgi:hypothetical protein
VRLCTKSASYSPPWPTAWIRVKKRLVHYRAQIWRNHVYDNLPFVSILRQVNLVHKLPFHFLNVRFLYYPPIYKQIFTREFFSAFQTILQAFLLSSLRARSTVHGLFLDPITLISLVQSTSHKLLTTQFHPDFYHFLPIRSKYLPDQTVVELPQSVFHLQCDRHVLQPYTLGESIIICNIFNLYSATYSTDKHGRTWRWPPTSL